MNARTVMAVASLVIMFTSAKAAAQGSYVGASVFGDIVRGSHTDDYGGFESGGEAFGFAVRIGTPLGAVWGIEAEFARPGEIEQEQDDVVFPLGQTTLSYTFGSETVPGSYNVFPSVTSLSPLILPFSSRTTQRSTTFSTALWVQQQLSARVSLVYLGGVGFYRTTREIEFRFPRRAIPQAILPPFESESTIYGVRPVVGLESQIALTEHAQLVPGIRLQAADNIWLLRPAVGLNWTF